MKKPIKFVIRYVPHEEIDYSRIVEAVYEMIVEKRKESEREQENSNNCNPTTK